MSNYYSKDSNGSDAYLAASGTGTNSDPYILQRSNSSTGSQREQIFQYLDSVGDGSGTTNLVGDYSGGATVFKIAPGAGEVFRLARMIGFVEDGGSFDSGYYGNAITLTNGIALNHDYGAGTVDMMGGLTVKTSGDWAGLCHDVTHSNFGSGNEFITVRWTFSKTGQYVRLDGDAGDELRMTLHDNFSGLVNHRFMIQGYIE